MSHIMLEKRFAPFFWTQFLGALNDNIFKNALIIMIAFSGSSQAQSGWLINLAGGLFILPFVLFSIIAGQLADKFQKTKIIVLTKIAEVIIMLIGSMGFFIGNIYFLIGILFLMGSQSAFFGPVKYSILPQILPDNKLIAGNSWVEMGTFIAILIGTILGGVLVHFHELSVALAVIIFAAIGCLTSFMIPKTDFYPTQTKISFNPLTQINQLIKVSCQNKMIFLSVVAISWFWLYGATFLSQFPTFVKFTLKGDELLVSTFLAVFTLSLALGSLICNLLSRSKLEIGLVPLGAIGMSIFGFDLGMIDYSIFTHENISVENFLLGNTRWAAMRIIIDILLLGISGSLFIVPLYATLQIRSSKETCSQVIAANNVINSIFIVGSAMLCMALYRVGVETQELFLLISLLTAIVSGIIFFIEKEFIKQLSIWLLGNKAVVLPSTWEETYSSPHQERPQSDTEHANFEP